MKKLSLSSLLLVPQLARDRARAQPLESLPPVMIVLALPPWRSVHLWSSAASITPDVSVGIHKSWSCLPGPHAFRSHQAFSGLGETQSEAPLRLGKPCAFRQGLEKTLVVSYGKHRPSSGCSTRTHQQMALPPHSGAAPAYRAPLECFYWACVRSYDRHNLSNSDFGMRESPCR